MQKRSRKITWFLIVLIIITAGANGLCNALSPNQKERDLLNKWESKYLGRKSSPLFSFILDGKTSSTILPGWKSEISRRKLDANRTGYIVTFSDPNSLLTVRCICTSYDDFPACEWLVEFENAGRKDTPVIENIQAIDLNLFESDEGMFRLHHALGSNHSENDFAPLVDMMPPGSEVVLSPTGGRSSDETALPFFSVEGDEEGVMVGIGWTGQWQARIKRNATSGINLQAGLETTYLRLHPGEKIRSPRILLLFWHEKDRLRGNNLLRQFILAYHTPHQKRTPVKGPFACNGGAFMFNEFTMATESSMIALAERYRQFDLQADYWWIDAGWYGSMDWHDGDWAPNVGNWYVRKEHFPNGLKPVSRTVNQLGMKLLLWFEPERVYRGTWLDRIHPEWIIRRKADDANGIFNLGDTEARLWLTDFISSMIEENGVDLYRQDFNIRPLEYWRSQDDPERQGMTEIRYIEGLYTFWDALRERHPGLIIDNCASGGRRLDLETISRSVALWRSDYNYREPTGRQNHTYGLSLYLPYHGTGCTIPDMYVARSTYASSMVTGWNLYSDNFPKDQAQYIYNEYRKIQPYFQGDFYPLTDYTTRSDKWMAYQFHREDQNAGIVFVFRRPRNSENTCTIGLSGLSGEALYELVYENNQATSVKSGNDLKKGLLVKINERPGSELISYRKVGLNAPEK